MSSELIWGVVLVGPLFVIAGAIQAIIIALNALAL